MTRYRPGPNAHDARVLTGGHIVIPGIDGMRHIDISPPFRDWLLAVGIIEEEPEPVTDADVVAWLRETFLAADYAWCDLMPERLRAHMMAEPS